MTNVVDGAARQKAIDPNHSYIVQAPAGSGKTELLTQRLLALLAGVDEPEHIVAITFTRKAAGEMRVRVMERLSEAGDIDLNTLPAHGRLTMELAKKVLARDKHRDWRLLKFPQRLNILTFDALNHSLVRQMPYLSKVGGAARVHDDAGELYALAAEQTLAHLESDVHPELASALFRILKDLDNQSAKLRSLLAEMLARRDQWLRHTSGGLADDNLRQLIESTISYLVDKELVETKQVLGSIFLTQLQPLAVYAGCNVASDSAISALQFWQDQVDLPQLQGIAELLLTADGSWRKTVNKRQGFPAGKTEQKPSMLALLKSYSEHQDKLEVLLKIKQLPAKQLDELSWQQFQDIIVILRFAVGFLTLTFTQQQTLDHVGVASAALHALGEELEPTDLALSKDMQIQHLLVDEFQDTSYGQFNLIEKLTQQWQIGDGRTLFVVGDPMQAIYGFREANVGLFIQAQANGIGSVQLTPLQLQNNFRSDPALIEWVNETFSRVFPPENNISKGAVSYHASIASIAQDTCAGVQVYPLLAPGDDDEARLISGIVKNQLLKTNTVGILVRSRNHAAAILAKLKEEQIAYQAIDLESLGDKQVIEDLTIVLRCLISPEDRIAWLSLLRAPHCGLTMTELLAIVAPSKQATVWQLLSGQHYQQALRPEALLRLEHFITVIGRVYRQWGRHSLAELAQGLWMALSGPKWVLSVAELKDAQIFFQVLAQVEASSDDVVDAVQQGLNKQFASAPTDEQSAKVQIMTIHKSKGLEFDCVILPGLAKQPQVNRKSMLQWQEVNTQLGQGLLMAPLQAISAQAKKTNKLYDFLRGFDKQKQDFELQRLLYVAATRAKNSLHLFAAVKLNNDKELVQPATTSMFAKLWSHYQSQYVDLEPAQELSEIVGDFKPQLAQITDSVLAQHPSYVANPQAFSSQADSRMPLELLTAQASILGTVVHQFLALIHDNWQQGWDAARLAALKPVVAAQLKQHGLLENGHHHATQIIDTLVELLGSDIGRWVVSPETKTHSHAELRLLRQETEGSSEHIVDRTFVENQVRWIIDYKNSHCAGDWDEFVVEQLNLYKSQLLRYRTLFLNIEDTKVKMGLYFTRYNKLVELTD